MKFIKITIFCVAIQFLSAFPIFSAHAQSECKSDRNDFGGYLAARMASLAQAAARADSRETLCQQWLSGLRADGRLISRISRMHVSVPVGCERGQLVPQYHPAGIKGECASSQTLTQKFGPQTLRGHWKWICGPFRMQYCDSDFVDGLMEIEIDLSQSGRVDGQMVASGIGMAYMSHAESAPPVLALIAPSSEAPSSQTRRYLAGFFDLNAFHMIDRPVWSFKLIWNARGASAQNAENYLHMHYD